MEKVKLPIRVKSAAVLLMLFIIPAMSLFLASMNCAGCYSSPTEDLPYFLITFFSVFFAILLLRRVKWAWYGTVMSIVLWIFFCLYWTGDILIRNASDFWEAILGDLIIVLVIIIPNAILLVLLFPKLKKYTNIKNIFVGLCIIIGLSVFFDTSYLDIKERNIGEALFFMSITILPSVILLKLLFSDRKKYLEVAFLEISSKRKKINTFIIIGLLTILGGGIASILSIEEDPCRGRSCLAGIKANLKTIVVQGELFYDDNDFRYSAANLSAPFSDECPEYGDGNTMFAKDRTIANAIEYVREVGDGNINVNCYMSADAQSWALDVRSKNDYYENYYGSWCTDSTGYAGDTTINPATGLCLE